MQMYHKDRTKWHPHRGVSPKWKRMKSLKTKEFPKSLEKTKNNIFNDSMCNVSKNLIIWKIKYKNHF